MQSSRSQPFNSDENAALLTCVQLGLCVGLVLHKGHWCKVKRSASNAVGGLATEGTEEGSTSSTSLEEQEQEQEADENDEEEDDADDCIVKPPSFSDSSSFIFLGYYVLEGATYERLEDEDMKERFANYPGFLEGSQGINCSFLRQVHWEFRLRPAFDFWEIVSQYKSRFIDHTDYEFMEIQNSTEPVTEDSTLTPNMTSEEMIQTLGKQGLDNFLSKVKPKPTSASHRNKGLYAVDAREAVVAAACLSCAAALRFDKSLSVINVDKMEVPLPLVCNGSQKIPDPQRMKAIACPNPFMDVGVTFFRSMANIHLSELGAMPSGNAPELKPFPAYKGSFFTPDLTKEANRDFMIDLFIMAIISCFTGDTAVLSLFPSWVKEYASTETNCHVVQSKLCLPTRLNLHYFLKFFLSFNEHYGVGSAGEKRNVFKYLASTHFRNAISSLFMKSPRGMENFCSFAEAIATHKEHGAPSIVTTMQRHQEMDAARLPRREVMDLLMKCINQCSGIPHGNSLLFMVHRVLLRLESFFVDGIFGQVTVDTIGFGYGSKVGCRVLSYDMQRGSLHGRFLHVHCLVMEELKKIDDDMELLRDLIGISYDRDSDEFRCCATGAIIDMSFTEHLCCKVYLCIVYSHPSRNAAQNPYVFSSHCWPLPGMQEWLTMVASQNEGLIEQFSAIRSLLSKMPEHFLHGKFPSQLQYHSYFYLDGESGKPIH